MNLTAIVPFLNEEKYLKDSVEALINYEFISEILLVNDGSTDKSYEIACKLSNNYKKIKLKNLTETKGKGFAINSVKNLISSTHIIIHDADLEYDPKDIINLFELAKENPTALIIGSRFIGNKTRKNIYRRTRIANILLSKIFSLVNKVQVSDIATCYKLFPSEFFIKNEFKEKGFTIELEILNRYLKSQDLSKILEVPISYNGRTYKDGKKIRFYDGFKYLFKIVSLKYSN